jgi:hypothetical protein
MGFAAAGEWPKISPRCVLPGKSVTLTAVKDVVSDPLYRVLA